MKNMTLKLLCAAFMLSSTSLAGQFNQAHIPAEARLVVHLDVEKFKSSEMWRLLRPGISEETWQEVDEIIDRFGSNPEKDIDGITLYGADSKEENAVIMIYGRFDKEKLLWLIKHEESKEECYEKSQYKGQKLYHWVGGGYSKEQIEVYLKRVRHEIESKVEKGELSEEEARLKMDKVEKDAWKQCEKEYVWMFATDSHIVFSQNEQAVQAMVDLLAGEGDSLDFQEEAELAELVKIREGAILIIAVKTKNRLSEFLENEPEAAILRNMKMLSVVAGEDNGEMYLTVNLTAVTEDAAMQIEKVFDGIVAMKTLEHTDQPEISSFLQAINLERNGSKLFLTVQYPSAKLDEIIEIIRHWFHHGYTKINQRQFFYGIQRCCLCLPVNILVKSI